MSAFNSIALVFVTIAVAIGAYFSFGFERVGIPSHLKFHPLIDKPDFLSEKTVDELLALSRQIGRISSASREYDSYKVVRDHIGEATPFDAERKKCPKTYLMPNGNKSMCVFPGRMDVGSHYVASGGLEGRKENFDLLVSRVQPFQAIILNWTQYPVCKRLLESDDLKALAKGVCPKDKQFLDPFQFNLVIQVPGQTVASHLDAPYFQRASRFSHPQWLLATMVFSGLFQDQFIDQVQLVGYYHKWKDTNRGGKFFFWNDDSRTAHISDPISGSGNSVDGSKVVHAAGVYMPERKPPILPRTMVNELVYNKASDKWTIEQDGNVIATYDEDEIRFSAVYRARCFKDAEAVAKFKKDQESNLMGLDEVLDVFRKDLTKRGIMWQKLDMYEFGLLLVKTYVRYPYSPNALIPFNYCALDRQFPSLAPLLKLFC